MNSRQVARDEEQRINESSPCYNCSVWHSICEIGYDSNRELHGCELYLDWAKENHISSKLEEGFDNE